MVEDKFVIYFVECCLGESMSTSKANNDTNLTAIDAELTDSKTELKDSHRVDRYTDICLVEDKHVILWIVLNAV